MGFLHRHPSHIKDNILNKKKQNQIFEKTQIFNLEIKIFVCQKARLRVHNKVLIIASMSGYSHDFT